ncbi:alpha-L-rhamnosidase [Microbispora sp. H10670]|uniref:alpha-L-rhamnosidase n=1 Tax=Microbispora sp. H10670 TaxID=2729108 RepID=UPI0016028323|nr:alpha-L-rhamnosidase [Microbispora sp. H10670]
MPLRIHDLKTDARTLPLGLGTPAPEFSWRLSAARADVRQTGYLIQVATRDGFGDGVLWDSGQVADDRPFGAVYAGPALESGRRYFWRVRVTDDSGARGAWSEPAWFETAMLDPSGWRAGWISGPPAPRGDDAVLYLRGRAELPAEVVRGRAYVSALGWYRFFVNGRDVTGDALVPRWTPLDHVVEYQTYDVTAHFRAGTNIVAMAVGDGRYRGHLGVAERRAVYGDQLAGFAQIELELADGSTVVVVTDRSWHAGPGRILGSDPKSGERVDLRVPDADWLTGERPPARMGPARVLPTAARGLVAEEVERVRLIDRLPPRRIWRSPSGRQLVDFGQNLAGVARVRLSGPSGVRVRLTYSELVAPDGELDTGYVVLYGDVREQRDEVTLGGGRSWYQPWFTTRGFRYLEIDGLDHDVAPDDVEALVLSTAVPQTGVFHASDERLNRLHRNVLWSVRANFADTATDCPTRERSGYTGDAQVFAPTAVTLVDAHAYLRRYLRNLALEQFEDGRIPPMIPSETSVFSGGPPAFARVVRGSVGWGDASVLLPWTLYRYYGDERVLDRQYGSMRRWIGHLERTARTRAGWARWFGRRVGRHERFVLDSGVHLGEWFRPKHRTATQLRRLLFDRPVVATAYFAHSTRLMARIAEVLGHDTDAAHYAELSRRVRTAWQAAFVRPDGRVGADGQDDYVRALAFDLLEEERRPAAFARLVELVQRAGAHPGTGLLSTSMLLPVLADGGRPDLAYALLLQDTPPSWLAQVERGATTVWETWEGYDRHGRGTLSHNHYAHGAVAGFLTEHVAGLTPDEPGYRVIGVRPLAGGGLTHASATVETPYGAASSSWRRDGGTVTLEVTIPAGATARVRLGDGRRERTGSGTHSFTWQDEQAAAPAVTAGRR